MKLIKQKNYYKIPRRWTLFGSLQILFDGVVLNY